MILLVMNEKGGVGKTTLAANLAVVAATRGASVILVDADPLQNSVAWWRRREEAEQQPHITCVPARGKIGRTVAELGQKYDLVVVDSGGRDSVEVRQALATCDRAVIPLRPSQNDVDALAVMEKLLAGYEDASGKKAPANTLLSAVSPNPFSHEGTETREMLQQFEGLPPLLTTQVCERVAFRKAHRGGLGVVELPTGLYDAKAAEEIESLYAEVVR